MSTSRAPNVQPAQPSTAVGNANDSGVATSPPKSRLNRVISIKEPEHPRSQMEDRSSDADEGSQDGSKHHHRLRRAGKRLAGHLPHRPHHHSPHSSPSVGPTQLESVAELPGTDEPHNQDMIGQVAQWLHNERQRRHARKQTQKRPRKNHLSNKDPEVSPYKNVVSQGQSDSEDSDGTVALNELERILKAAPSLSTSSFERPSSMRRASRGIKGSVSSLRKSRTSTVHSSDTEYQDGEPFIPDCEAYLDNSKTVSEGADDHEDDPQAREAVWADFKHEIVRLTHTLRLKGWRRVPLKDSSKIEVCRLSGALTNAVYVVTPPSEIPASNNLLTGNESRTAESQTQHGTPAKLLLRIYGPQAGALIDRDSELQILRRLGRQNIGPRLLGTFTNGRFEQFLKASPLTPIDLRTPEVSKQIAKRMRELHDGIELLREEREAGPFVWSNWDKWVERCEKVVNHIDGQLARKTARRSSTITLKSRQQVCGTNWATFKATVERYRKWVNDSYERKGGVKTQLIFAHNDTQYGNILRMEPPGQSPLLLPANSHKQLVVIDFEYANANCPGIEFSNHFTEWCYDYHHPTHSYLCDTERYPSHEEQKRFIDAYVSHQPNFPSATAATPRFNAARHSISSISSVHTGGSKRPGLPTHDSFSSTFTLGPPIICEEPSEVETQTTESRLAVQLDSCNINADSLDYIDALIRETRLWRPANTAQWVAWGIMQAHVPGLDDEQPSAETNGSAGALTVDGSAESKGEDSSSTNGTSEAIDEEKEKEEESGGSFDYLRYARERALFFWGDMVQLGFVAAEELPEDVRRDLKVVMY